MLYCPGVETLGGKYELHDLVQLDAHTAGVIVGIDKDTARVLTNQSTLQKNDIRLCRVSGSAVHCGWTVWEDFGGGECEGEGEGLSPPLHPLPSSLLWVDSFGGCGG